MLTGVTAAAVGAGILHALPQIRLEVFARTAAQLLAWCSGSELARGETGWAMTLADQRVVVTTACSGSDFYLMAAALLGWRCCGARRAGPAAVLASLALALPFAVVVNALRIAAVAHAHRWIIPALPDAARAFAHMLTGVAVFLPALIALNIVLEAHAHRRRSCLA